MIDNRLIEELERYLEESKMEGWKKSFRIPSFKRNNALLQEINKYIVQNRRASFMQQLFEYIDRTGCKDSEIYKKAWIDRRLFSKIRCNKNYVPCKKTVMALCIALELSKEEAEKLLSSAGYSLSRANDFDLIISFCIEKKIYDFYDINDALEYYDLEVF